MKDMKAKLIVLILLFITAMSVLISCNKDEEMRIAL